MSKVGGGTAAPTLTGAPTLETDRLRLRAHRLEDFEPFVAMWAHPDVIRFIGGRPFTRQESWGRFIRYPGHWSLLGFGYWAVEEKSTGRFIGEVGFADFKREMEPSIEGVPELGWALAPEAHGKGYATEALRAVVAWGGANWGSDRTVCIINPENVASIRVATKLGFREHARTSYAGAPTILFER